MSAINMSVSQEFFQEGSGVNLVLFKGGRPSTIREVPPHELWSMGWRRGGEFNPVEQQSAEDHHWRYVTFDGHPNGVFVVDLDGDFLGVYAREIKTRV